MTQPPVDVRAVTEYRIPAPTLLAGDLVNTAPGGEDDWQQVLSVHTAETPGDDTDARRRADRRDRRPVRRRPADRRRAGGQPVYFADGAALAYGADGEDDGPVAEVCPSPTRSGPSSTPASSWSTSGPARADVGRPR